MDQGAVKVSNLGFTNQPRESTTKPLNQPKPDLNKIRERIVEPDYCIRALRMLLNANKASERRKDAPGFIHVFRKDSRATENTRQWKVGSTKIGAIKRTRQWSKQCKIGVVLQDAIEVNRHRLCERLIHFELKAKKRWMGSVRCECKISQGHCEWFMGTFEEIHEVVEFWSNYVNHLFGDSNSGH
ncbi:hypothetical protein HK104_009539 [Borealophlyctis nickersoniae]|nr:hypothetical protein HK104_009539 [Borealophlyctis nickersoniae]